MIFDDNKPKVISSILSMKPDDGGSDMDGPSPDALELLAHDFMDAVHNRDAMALLHAFEALYCAYEYQDEGHEEPSEEE